MLQCPRGPSNGKKSIGGLDTNIIWISVAIHAAVFVLALLAGIVGHKEKLEFVVYGAYSKQPCQVLFKPMNSMGKVGGVKGAGLKLGQKNSQKKEVKKLKSLKKSKKECSIKKEKRVPKASLVAQAKQAAGPTIRDLEAEEAALIAKLKLSKKKKQKKEKELKQLQKKEQELKVLQKKEQELKMLLAEEERLKHELVKTKEEEKKQEQLRKKEEKKRQEEEKKVQDEVEVLESSENLEQVPGDESLEFTVQNEMHGVPHYNLMGNVDPRRIAMQNAVQEAISTVWSPPVGVAKGTEARVYFKVDERGVIVEFEIEQPSGIVIFDTSIMRSAADIKFPKAVWGRGFPITYQQ